MIGDTCFQPVNLNSTDVSFEEADKFCSDTLNGSLAEFDSEDEKGKVYTHYDQSQLSWESITWPCGGDAQQ